MYTRFTKSRRCLEKRSKEQWINETKKKPKKKKKRSVKNLEFHRFFKNTMTGVGGQHDDCCEHEKRSIRWTLCLLQSKQCNNLKTNRSSFVCEKQFSLLVMGWERALQVVLLLNTSLSRQNSQNVAYTQTQIIPTLCTWRWNIVQ